eukprot:gnl/MRDRNA2_/MRDRNA2_27917_c0_seq1.p1 gnl/MRDRNA2_/MRDRNA2_27917_c0~~gnl/MRDRNA2_/MRDRNA2_27917_c0_seq1.p1  ORF type:complete len:255 (+),score=52.58 gnl/MRDRNA2_/MRDRNA2_27917_c0_seq1:74-838(+)
MSNVSVTLSKPLLQEAGYNSLRHSLKTLAFVSLLLGAGFAACALSQNSDAVGAQSQAIAMSGLRGMPSSKQNVGLVPRLAPTSWKHNPRRQLQPVQALREENAVLKGASAVVTPLLKGIYAAQAPLQAKVLGAFGGPSEEEVRAEIDSTIKSNKVVIYSYPLSPFCTEAIALLESTGCKFTTIEPGQEWFLMGPKGSAIRAELGQMTGQTSLPHIFINGQSVGGLYSGGPSEGGIAGLAESGELLPMLKKAGAC